MIANEASIGEVYVNNKGTRFTVTRMEGNKVFVRVHSSGNEVSIPLDYEVKPCKFNSEKLEEPMGKGKSGVGYKVRLKPLKNGVSISGIIDPLLQQGKHTEKEIAELLEKKLGAESKGKNLRANIRARLHLFKKKGFTVRRSDENRLAVVKM